MDNLWIIYIGYGWWYTYPSEKYWSIGMIIPNLWENKQCITMFHTANQKILKYGRFLQILPSPLTPDKFSDI